ncbi:3-oxoacyl-synth [Xylona heveae TC161]|uniref:beta-ketoacyl-[acyl-carrier-protein] synthase I n=1 Tax=Xylona heveae (strain CBS 132557 / TC161) TaxID=1328760 RepID=A0A165FWY4_XYLHT|nr:3-oxoacyl-synth [Xylona heveae TC161]KZF21484.1 3-oxoacyl-synth [Xylona heveae TC161]
MRRVVVTGLGAITPLGVGVRRSWSRLLDGSCGIVSVKDKGPQFAALPSQVAALVPTGSKTTGGWDRTEWLAPGEDRRMALFTQYAIAASQEALEDAEWKPTSQENQEATGVCMGSGIGNFDDVYNTSVAYEKGGYKKVSPLFVPKLLINLAAGHISMKYGFKGPNHAVTTACTTGAHAIGDASRFIAFGDADVMVAGGAESCIHPLAIAGFARAKSLSTEFNDTPHLSSRPFDKDRCGFVIGEGAGVVVLEELEHAKARGARIYAEVKGYGLSADAHHMTAPIESGQGAYLAMKRALKHAKVKPSDVDYVNAHATSTRIGDIAENFAIKSLLLGEDGWKKPSEVNISGSKGAIGHLLGAAGAVEAIFTTLAVKENILPPTLNLENFDEPGNDFDCNYVPGTAQEKKVGLTNIRIHHGDNTAVRVEAAVTGEADEINAQVIMASKDANNSLIDTTNIKFTKADRTPGTIKIKKPAPKQTKPGNPNSEVIGTSPGSIVNQLDEKDLANFPTGRPMEDRPDCVVCKHCKKPVLKTVAANHVANCLQKKQEKAKKKKEAKESKDTKDKGKDKDADTKADDGAKASAEQPDGAPEKTKGAKKNAVKATTQGKKRKADGDAEKAPKAKKKKDEPKPKVPKPKGPVDVERQCGVPLPNGAQCARSLTCKSHSMGAKRAVPGRSLPYDMLLAQYQKKNQAKQQKAAIDANAPLQDEFEATGPVDSDEEKDNVMAALARSRPYPMESRILISTRRKYQYVRMKEMLSNALGGSRGSGLFSAGDAGNRGISVNGGDAEVANGLPSAATAGNTEGGHSRRPSLLQQAVTSQSKAILPGQGSKKAATPAPAGS